MQIEMLNNSTRLQPLSYSLIKVVLESDPLCNLGDLMLTIYKTHIRILLEFGSAFWNIGLCKYQFETEMTKFHYKYLLIYCTCVCVCNNYGHYCQLTKYFQPA